VYLVTRGQAGALPPWYGPFSAWRAVADELRMSVPEVARLAQVQPCWVKWAWVAHASEQRARQSTTTRMDEAS
jgi:hypothetical protein